MIFHKFLELHSKSFEKKKMFVTNFPFLTDSLKPPLPPPPPPIISPPQSAKRDKGFLSMLPKLSWFFKIIML